MIIFITLLYQLGDVKATFLGTGTSQGIPVIACSCRVCNSTDSRDMRLRSSLLLETGTHSLVIDAGPDFRQQILREKVTSLDAILLTHEHKDHIGGMDDVRAFNFKTNRAIDIYSDTRVQRAIRTEYPYVFADKKYPGSPMMNLHTIASDPFELFGIQVLPLKVLHSRLPVLGFRIGDFAYVTDANHIPQESMEKLRGVKYFVVNALRREKHMSHFSLPEALEIIRTVAPERAFLTHIGHQMGLHADVEREMPPGTELAYDGLNITF